MEVMQLNAQLDQLLTTRMQVSTQFTAPVEEAILLSARLNQLLPKIREMLVDHLHNTIINNNKGLASDLLLSPKARKSHLPSPN